MTTNAIRGSDYRIDYNFAVARGSVPGSRPFSGYGLKTTTGADSGVLWPNGAFVFPAAAGVQISFVSTSVQDAAAGTGIRTLDMHYLDADLIERVEVIALNGTTPVLSVVTNVRYIQCLHMVTWGSGKAAAGNISASNAGNTHSYISTGAVRCTSSMRMVPAGKRLLVQAMHAGSISGTAAASTLVNAVTATFDGHDFTSANVFVPIASAAFQDGSSGIQIPSPPSFTEGMSFGFTFSTDKAATIAGSWFGILEDI